METQLRVGLGTDLHRLTPGLPLVVGGVILESPWGCEAHSDGDALIHALIDALLGPTGFGDIGTLYPPSDDAWKGVSSAWLLQDALKHINERFPHFLILNVDCVVHLQLPKLLPHRTAIQSRLSELLGVEASCVSVKAKTGEGLYPIGTHEAIETQVVVLMSL
jgi:2-C-methyl-D-erythritol 2,4-cyclodiphosphate synthase